MLFNGYGENTNGYRCIDPLTKKIVPSRENQIKVIESDSIEIDENVVSVGDADNKNKSPEEDDLNEHYSSSQGSIGCKGMLATIWHRLH